MIKTICFLATYQCNAKCDFCECRPDVKDRIELNEMIRLIDEAYSLGTVFVVVFSGGEPTLLKDDLLRAISHAHNKGLQTRVVTNGWWGGKKIEIGRAYLDKLISAGLSEINISVDDLHQEWIGIENVKNAFLACYERKFKCLIAHKQTKSSKITKSYLEDYFGIKLVNYDPAKIYTEEEQTRLISTSVVIPVGPVNEGNEEIYDSDEMSYSNWTKSCSSVLKDIIVGAKGNFLPCCGIVTKNTPELTREDLKTTSLIDAIDNANNDLMLNWIALEGPAAIAKFAKSKDESIHLEERYTGICHICNEVLTRNDIRKVIADNLPEIKERVAYQRAFLEKVRDDKELVKVYI